SHPPHPGTVWARPPPDALPFFDPALSPATTVHVFHALLGRPGLLLSRFAEVAAPFMLLHAARSSRRCIWTRVIRLLPHLPRPLPANVLSDARSPPSLPGWRLHRPPCDCPRSAGQSSWARRTIP